MHSGAFTASSVRWFRGLLVAVCWLGCYVQVLTPPPLHPVSVQMK